MPESSEGGRSTLDGPCTQLLIRAFRRDLGTSLDIRDFLATTFFRGAPCLFPQSALQLLIPESSAGELVPSSNLSLAAKLRHVVSVITHEFPSGDTPETPSWGLHADSSSGSK